MIDNGLNAHAAAHLTSLWQVFRNAGAAKWQDQAYESNDVIESVTGQPRQTIDEFFQANATHFTESVAR